MKVILQISFYKNWIWVVQLVIYVNLLPHYDKDELSHLLFSHVVACKMYVIRNYHGVKVKKLHNLFTNLFLSKGP